jgi:hypothetical protein
MKTGKYFLRFAAGLLIWSFFRCGLTVADPEQMLSPAIMINSQTFIQNMSLISEQPFIDPLAPLADKIKDSRRVFHEQNNNNEDFSLWPKFFLKNVLSSGTDNLKAIMRELIQWMDSDSFKQMGDLERLGHIEDMSRELTPFERILFYEGVYFVEPAGSDLGFNINTKRDWGVLYFYKKTLFAHGAVRYGGASLELTFGDDLARRDLLKIKHVHYYAYMKRLADVYAENPGKFLIIPNDQLLALATYTNKNFMPQSLNFYLVKVGGFMPEYEAPDGKEKQLQLEYLSQLENGLHISFKDAMQIVNAFDLNRDIPAEEEQYLNQAYKQNYPSREISNHRIRSRDILSLPKDKIKMIDDEKYPVEVKDKIVVDNLGYCSGAVFSSRGRMWFRRYGENPYIMEALEKDFGADNADEIFNNDTRVVLMSTGYGSWRWVLDDVKLRLVKAGLREENILILDSGSKPDLDGIGIYLSLDKQVIIFKKNHGQGIFEVVRFTDNLKDFHAPLILSRFDVEDLALEKQSNIPVLKDMKTWELSLAQEVRSIEHSI